MDYLMQLLRSLMQKEESAHWLFLVMVFTAIFMLVVAFMALSARYFDPVRIRYKKTGNRDVLLPLESENLSDQLLKYHPLYLPVNTSLLQRTATRLHYAGFHLKNNLLYYYAIKMVLTVLLPVGLVIVAMFIPVIKKSLVEGVLLAMAIGYLGPSFILDKLISIRQKALKRSFPEFLDMIVICSEAGLGLDAAIQRVAEELVIGHPELASELSLVIAETRAGVEREVALRRIVERTGLDDIKGLVATLTQSMRFGSSIAEALRMFSEDLRDKRTQAAENTAAKIGLKLIFPLGICLLPAFLLVVMGPVFVILKKFISL